MNTEIWNLDDEAFAVESWNLDDDDTGIPKAPKPQSVPHDPGAAHPVNSFPYDRWAGKFPSEYIPQIAVAARVVILQTQVALAIPVILATGLALYHSRYLPEIIVASCPVTFAIGLWFFIRHQRRWKIERESYFPLSPENSPEPSPVQYLLFPTLMVPGAIFLGSTLTVWFSNRFIAAALPAVLTFAAFIRWGEKPINFYYQYLICQIGMPLHYRRTKAPLNARANFPLLGLLLAMVVSIPIVSSVSFGILAVVLTVGYQLLVRALDMSKRRGFAVLPYFLTQAYRILRTYLDYPDVYPGERQLELQDQWIPPEIQLRRKATFYGLLSVLYLSLILGLTYYCPWDVFARFFVMDPQSITFSSFPALEPYAWLFAPFALLPFASPLAGYLFCFVIALALCVVLPPALLLIVYHPQLMALETLHQELKAARAATAR